MLLWRRPRRLPPDNQLEVETLVSALRGEAPVAFGLGEESHRAGLGRLRQWLPDLSTSRRRWV